MLDPERKQEISRLCIEYANKPANELLKYITTLELFQFMIQCTKDVLERHGKIKSDVSPDLGPDFYN